MLFNRTDWILLAGLFFLLLAAGTAGWLLVGPYSLVLLIAAAVTAVVGILLAIHRTLKGRMLELLAGHDQVQALFSLFSALPIRHPLPQMRVWTITPDFAVLLVSLILEHRPRRIVECGSGVSTLISAYCLDELGRGQIVSLEHDAHYAGQTEKHLRQHGVLERADIRHAPLQPVEIAGQTWPWYAVESIQDLDAIDLLIVDGPPAGAVPMARYPALPLLIERLSRDAVVVLDDADRLDERSSLERWLGEYEGWEVDHVATERGAGILRRV